MPFSDLTHDEEGYTSFHVKLIDAKGKERHAFTRVGGGAITGKQLANSFMENGRFSKCKEVTIIPIDGDVFPAGFIDLINKKPMVDEVIQPKIQIGDPIKMEDFDKQSGKFHVVTDELVRKQENAAIA